MKLKEIHRTSTFAWSPNAGTPWIATATVAGALDASFSNESQLEIWEPDFTDGNKFDLGGENQTGPVGNVVVDARFNRIAWGGQDASKPKGIVAGGMENGTLTLWDPIKLIAKEDESVVLTNSTHTGPIRGLDFNPIQTNLLASGAVNGEIYIWNLQDPSKPYSPGTRSSKLDDITSLAWNRQVPYVLATASNTGYTVVWDLRGKREVVALAYTGASGQVGGGMSMGGRKGMSDVCWHPDNATRLVTSSEDDSSPVVMMWDLRNARAPEKVLNGHEKGVLSVSWCKQDADLLLSCGKDNRSICWNPQTAEMIGELPIANNWAFEVQWCPSNPGLLASAAFDGTIGLHSVQSIMTEELPSAAAAAPQPDGADIFDAPSIVLSASSQPSLSLSQAPKWLRVPVSASFGYGGKLVSISNLPGPSGASQSSVVHLRQVATEKGIVERAEKLRTAADEGTLEAFVEAKAAASGHDQETWKALLSLFRADSRTELITMLGFSKEDVANKVASAIATKGSKSPSTSEEPSKPHEPVVSFADPDPEVDDTETEGEVPEASAAALMNEGTPSEVSLSTNKTADAESTHLTEPSLFGEEGNTIGTPHNESAADFFSSMGTIRGPVPPHVLVPHTSYAKDSSVAATVGSRPSSVASDALSLSAKNSTFRMYPKDENIVDQLITKSLVVGDFESAVALCLSAERFADAILLAVRGGSELLQSTQKTYFEKKTPTLPYLRVYQSIVMNDLSDIVQNADLNEWQEIFVVLCTFAKTDEFWNLAEQLGQRLEFQGSIIRSSDMSESEKNARALEYRKNATLCYLAANKLDKVVGIWLEEMKEEEELISKDTSAGASVYTSHSQALQTFIEKVTVFRGATKYVDTDVATAATAQTDPARSYKLNSLYDRYFEYADLLAAQGSIALAVEFINLTPAKYDGPTGSTIEFSIARERLLSASGARPTQKSTLPVPTTTTTSSRAPAAGYSYDSYPSVAQVPQPSNVPAAIPPSVSSYGSQYATPAYASQQASSSGYGAPTYASTNGNAAPYGAPSYAPAGARVSVPPPPPPISGSDPGTPQPSQLPPPPRKMEKVGGWNDAPLVPSRSPAGAAHGPPKAAPITSPFPQSQSPAQQQGPFTHGASSPGMPPPPRGGTPQLGGPPRPASGQGIAPPPRGSSFVRPPQPSAPLPPPQSRGPMGGPQQFVPPPPQQQPQGPYPPNPVRVTSPPQGQPPMRPPQTMSPPMRAAPPSNAPPPQPPQQSFAQPPPIAGGHGPSNIVPPRGPYGPPSAHGSTVNNQYGPTPGLSGHGGFTQAPPPHAALPPAASGPPPAAAPPPPKAAPAAPKYPPGDRTHIPPALKPIFDILTGELEQLKHTTPPQQRRLVEDTERRLNVLFDALNCETLSPPVVNQLLNLVQVINSHNRDQALAIHMNLLTNGSRSDDIGLWMSGIKQLILRL